jgi:hypothetical protein
MTLYLKQKWVPYPYLCDIRIHYWASPRVDINLQYHSPRVEINENQQSKPIFHQPNPTLWHRRPDRPKKSSRPFADLVTQMNPCSRQPLYPLGLVFPTLVHPSCQCAPISWSFHTSTSPLVCSHAQGIHLPNLGAKANPSSVSLRTWEKDYAPI